MHIPRPHLNCRTRHALAVAVVFAQVVAATGAPVFVPQKSSKTVPYPCQSHACGCSASEQSWAGDCCCYTLEQKLAWAEARGIEPPEHVRPLVAARAARKAKPACCSKPKKPSCCAANESAEAKCDDAPPAPKLQWVAGIFAQKCRGDGPGGLLEAAASVAPELPLVVRGVRPTRDFTRAPDSHVQTTSVRPPVPPPRSS